MVTPRPQALRSGSRPLAAVAAQVYGIAARRPVWNYVSPIEPLLLGGRRNALITLISMGGGGGLRQRWRGNCHYSDGYHQHLHGRFLSCSNPIGNAGLRNWVAFAAGAGVEHEAARPNARVA
jgi:hypothetical protein